MSEVVGTCPPEAGVTRTIARSTYAGLLTVSLATILFQILLTRIFSVTIWYHFAFVAISVAMFGFAAAGVLIQCFPKYFADQIITHRITVSSLLCGTSMVASFIVHLLLPAHTYSSILGSARVVTTYVVVCIPFFFSGIVVCLSLTRFPAQVGSLYAADLIGAALACPLIILLLEFVDAPTAVILAGALACAAAIFFSWTIPNRRLRIAACATTALLALLACLHGVDAAAGDGVLRPVWLRGKQEAPPLYEDWNSYSRVTVHGNPEHRSKPFGWGLSSTYATQDLVAQLYLTIDSTAGTVITQYDGQNLNNLDFLKYDVVNIAHYLRPSADVFVVGVGGGRDILTALVFNQRSVVALEVNSSIVEILTGSFGDFAGRFDRDPRVTLLNDEARSYAARARDRFDIIQMSLTDTWAATAAGAFVLTENTLYTIEAWETFLKRLAPGGVLSVSRHYVESEPLEIYRLASLAQSVLSRAGISNPRRHFAIVRSGHPNSLDKDSPDGVANLLLSNEALTKRDLSTLTQISERLDFEVLLSPTVAADDNLLKITSPQESPSFVSLYPKDISPPTDNRPFFFNMARLKDYVDRDNPVFVLTLLLLTVLLLVLVCILLPMGLTSKEISRSGCGSLIAYFAAIGLGFMLVEVALVQRIIVLLGHPTYALSVVLFVLLLSAGIGSYFTTRISDVNSFVSKLLCCAAAGIAALGVLTPALVEFFQASSSPVRVAIAIGVIALPAVLMGMPLPAGIRIAAERCPGITPWLWAINGAFSTLASIVGAVVSLTVGISAGFWIGAGCYLAAFLMIREPVAK